MAYSGKNKYFVLFPHAQFVRGKKGSIIHDLFDAKLYWFRSHEISEALALIAKGRPVEEVVHRTRLQKKVLRQYLDALEHLCVGHYAPHPFATEGYRPWPLDSQVKKEGLNFQGGTVTLEISNDCIYNCEWCASKCSFTVEPCVCFVSRGGGPKLRLQKIVNGIKLLRSLGFDRLVISGGEPFREANRLWHLIELASLLRMKCEIHTTGLVDIDTIKRLRTFDVHVTLLIAASDASAFDKAVRRPFSYYSLLDSINHFAAWGVKFAAKIPAKIGHEEDSIATADWVMEQGATGVKFIVYGFPEQYTLDSFRRIVTPKKPVDMAVGLRQFMVNSQRHSCFYNAIFIGADGSVKPCPGWKTTVASLHNKDLATILREGFFERFSTTARKDVPLCSACEFRFGCWACLVRTVEWKGSLKARHWLCNYEPEAGKWKE